MVATVFEQAGVRRAGEVFMAAIAVSCLVALCAVTGVAMAAGDSNEESCPNEGLAGFATYLPDCRGYELLSPAYEDGQPLILRSISEESSDGLHMVFASLGDATGADNQTAQALEPTILEVGHDGSSAWGASSLSPHPGQELADSADEFLGASANLSGTIWAARAVSRPIFGANLYERTSPGGSFVPVGPIFSSEVLEKAPIATGGNTLDTIEENSFFYAGASSDLSHIFFVLATEGPTGRLLWPGDETEGPLTQSLYEYSGTGNTVPTLVGVKGATGSSELISRCGTYLGSSSEVPLTLDGSMYNAIADEGSRIFFTAVGCEGGKQPTVSELYARVDGSGSSDGSGTVAISEPSLPRGAECTEGHACFGAAHKEAIFQGASLDGSKVFFLTEQPLVNGDEDETMDLYEAELEGEGRDAKVGKLSQISHDSTSSQPAEVQGVLRISMDGSHVYFVAKGDLATNINSQGQQAVEGSNNLYLYEQDARYPQGHLVFVATLSPADEEDWSAKDKRFVQTNECSPKEECERGRFLIFLSRAHLTPTDTSETSSGEDLPQLFEYDAVTGEIVRVSSGEKSEAYVAGYNQDGNITEAADMPEINKPQFNTINFPGSTDSPAEVLSSLNLSSDGSRVVFTSQDGLVPGSVSGCKSAYEYRSTGPISHGNVYLISDGRDTTGESLEDCGSQQVWMDPSGADVLFQSGDSLVPGAGIGIKDFYDAREDGGSVVNSGSSGCSEEACRPESGPPLLPSAVSMSQTGEADVTPTVTKPVTTKKKSKSHKLKKKKPRTSTKKKVGKTRRKPSR